MVVQEDGTRRRSRRPRGIPSRRCPRSCLYPPDSCVFDSSRLFRSRLFAQQYTLGAPACTTVLYALYHIDELNTVPIIGSSHAPRSPMRYHYRTAHMQARSISNECATRTVNTLRPCICLTALRSSALLAARTCCPSIGVSHSISSREARFRPLHSRRRFEHHPSPRMTLPAADGVGVTGALPSVS